LYEEIFNYDQDLNRLTGATVTDENIEQEFLYSPNGNLEKKTGVGTYVYDQNKINAVVQIDLDGGMDINGPNNSVEGQFVEYNFANLASNIVQDNGPTPIALQLQYGPDNARKRTDFFEGSPENEVLIKSRYFIGQYEKQISANNEEIEVHYIHAGGAIVAMYVIENGIGQYYYPHQDHLGSIIHITDENAEMVYTQSFDAWGRARNPDDLTYEDITERPNWLWRGYTGHEHIDEFGLINMNGRLYDPVIGRMLSPDPFLHGLTNTQGYNRYSYAFNNPLKYTDPSGYIPFYVLPHVYVNSNGTVDFGVSVVVGYPVGVSASLTVGYSTGSKGNFYATVGVSVSLGIVSVGVYAGYSSQSGIIAGAHIGVGLPNQSSNFNPSTNLTSAGIHISQKNGVSISIGHKSYNSKSGTWSSQMSFGFSYQVHEGQIFAGSNNSSNSSTNYPDFDDRKYNPRGGLMDTDPPKESATLSDDKINELVDKMMDDHLGTGTSKRLNSRNGIGKELSSLSFQFQKTSSNWQVAVVSNLVMSIQVAGQPGTYKAVNFSIEVGVPITLFRKISISEAYAAKQAAWAANQTAVIVGGIYASQYFNPGTSTALPKQFALTMQGMLSTEIPGVRITSPPITPGVIPTPAIFVNSPWWNIFGK